MCIVCVLLYQEKCLISKSLKMLIDFPILALTDYFDLKKETKALGFIPTVAILVLFVISTLL